MTDAEPKSTEISESNGSEVENKPTDAGNNEKPVQDPTQSENPTTEAESDSVSADPTAEVDKSDSTTTSTSLSTDVSPLDKKIIRQVEYYFGNANLDRDKFLNEEIKKDDGWVSLKTLLTFNRLKSMSEDPAVIISALQKSTNDLLEVKSDDSAIRRHPTRPLPSADVRKQDVQKRLLYVKGFPTDLTLDDLIDYFEQYGGESVQLRNDIKRKFKGSVFVLFKTAEQAKEYLEATEMKYKDTPLIERLYKQDYFKRKQDEKLGGKKEDIKKKEEQKQKKEQEEKEELQARITKGSVLKVNGIEPETTVDKIKEFFGKFGKIAWVDFEKGEDHAMVRYATENEATEAWSKAQEEAENKKVILNDKELTAVVIEGEEEEAHWKKVFDSINNRFKGNKSKFGRGGYRGGRGGGRGGHKRRNAGDNDGATAEKRSKADD